MDFVHRMNILDVSIFKFTIFFAALWLAKLFPVLLTGNTWFYFGMYCVGLIYILFRIDWA